jgi:type III secretion system YscJ/HrcJ family lipoprotein
MKHIDTNTYKVSTYSYLNNRTKLSLFLLFSILVIGSGCSKKESLATVASETEANEIIGLLSEKGIEASKEEIGDTDIKQWKVSIHDDIFGGGKLPLAIRVMQEHGLPRPADKGMEGAYGEQSMFPSESALKAQRLKELKTEIERQLRLLPSVVRVNVNIVPPEEDTINIDPYPATASVLIVHRDEKAAFTAAYIQELVAKGVPKLKTENVSVVMVHEPSKSVSIEGMMAQRRRNIIYIMGIGLVVCLTLLLIGLVWYSRRQREGESNKPKEAIDSSSKALSTNTDTKLSDVKE